jgi:hypothetical protein
MILQNAALLVAAFHIKLIKAFWDQHAEKVGSEKTHMSSNYDTQCEHFSGSFHTSEVHLLKKCLL